MRRLLHSSLIALLALVVSIVTATAPVLAFTYQAPLTITNSSLTTSYAMLPVMVSVNNTFLAANGFMNSTANDTRVQNLGGTNYPHLVADNKTLTALPVPVSSQTNLHFLTGESEQPSMDIITGYGGYITTANATNLPGSNIFRFQVGGLYLGSENETILSKTGVIDWFWYAATNNLTARFYGTSASTELLVDGDGDYIGLLASAGANWQCVNETYAAPNDADYVSMTAAGTGQDRYTIQNGAIPSDALINSVTVYFRGRTAGATGNATPALRLYGNQTTGTKVALGGAFATSSQALSRPGGGNWLATDIPDLQAVILLGSIGPGSDTLCSQISVVVNYSTVVSQVSAITIKGEHEIALSDNSTHVALFIDDLVIPVSISAWAGSLVSNGNSWIMLSNVPYVEYFKIWK